MKIYFLDLNPRLSARFVMDKHISRALIDAVQLLSTAMVRAGYWAPYHPQDGTWQVNPDRFRNLLQPNWPIKYKRGVPVSTIIERQLNIIRSLCPHSNREFVGPITEKNAKTYSYKKALYLHWLESAGNMDHINWVYEYAEELGSEYSRRWGLRKNDPDKIFHPAHLALFEMKNREYGEFWKGSGIVRNFGKSITRSVRPQAVKPYNYKDMTTWPLKIFSVGNFPENHYQCRSPGQLPTVLWPHYITDDHHSRSITSDMPKCSIFNGLREAMNLISKEIEDREIPSYKGVLSASFSRRLLPPFVVYEEWSMAFLHNAGYELIRVIAANRLRYLCLNGTNEKLMNNSWSPPLKRTERVDNREENRWFKSRIDGGDYWRISDMGGPPMPFFRSLVIIKKTCPWWFSNTYGEAKRHFKIFRKLCGRTRSCKCWCPKCNRGNNE